MDEYWQRNTENRLAIWYFFHFQSGRKFKEALYSFSSAFELAKPINSSFSQHRNINNEQIFDYTFCLKTDACRIMIENENDDKILFISISSFAFPISNAMLSIFLPVCLSAVGVVHQLLLWLARQPNVYPIWTLINGEVWLTSFFLAEHGLNAAFFSGLWKRQIFLGTRLEMPLGVLFAPHIQTNFCTPMVWILFRIWIWNSVK